MHIINVHLSIYIYTHMYVCVWSSSVFGLHYCFERSWFKYHEVLAPIISFPNMVCNDCHIKNIITCYASFPQLWVVWCSATAEWLPTVLRWWFRDRVGSHSYRITYIPSFQVTVGTGETNPLSNEYVIPKMLCQEIILILIPRRRVTAARCMTLCQC